MPVLVLKEVTKKPAARAIQLVLAGLLKKFAMVGGSRSNENAKISGIIPAELTRKGIWVDPA